MMLHLQLKHGSAKHAVDLAPEATIADLMVSAEAATGVPTSGQKLILNGRALTSLDHAKSLAECRVANYAKVMVLGKKFDPEGDQVYKQVVSVEKKTLEIDSRLKEVATELKDIELGYLQSEHHEKALKGLLKRSKGGGEELMRSLETLDAMSFGDTETMAKQKRKTVVNKVNAVMDWNEELQKKINTLLE